ncbi:hypothetical protein ACLKA6_014547 [Drosophila palustris]
MIIPLLGLENAGRKGGNREALRIQPHQHEGPQLLQQPPQGPQQGPPQQPKHGPVAQHGPQTLGPKQPPPQQPPQGPQQPPQGPQHMIDPLDVPKPNTI